MGKDEDADGFDGSSCKDSNVATDEAKLCLLEVQRPDDCRAWVVRVMKAVLKSISGGPKMVSTELVQWTD